MYCLSFRQGRTIFVLDLWLFLLRKLTYFVTKPVFKDKTLNHYKWWIVLANDAIFQLQYKTLFSPQQWNLERSGTVHCHTSTSLWILRPHMSRKRANESSRSRGCVWIELSFLPHYNIRTWILRSRTASTSHERMRLKSNSIFLFVAILEHVQRFRVTSRLQQNFQPDTFLLYALFF